MSDGRVLFCRGEEDEADHDDIWEDTELIAAYDRALASARAELGMTGGPAEEKPTKKWRIGDFCRAMYSEDGLTYEAEILSIGGARCRLRYVGYGNEEDLPLVRLQPTAGKKARRKQEKEAEAERQAEEEEYGEEDGQEVENEEDERDPEEELFVPAPQGGKATQRSLRKSRKSAQQRDNEAQDISTAGQSYPTASRQSEQTSRYPGQNFRTWGPWGAGSEYNGPATGPWSHMGPWGTGQGPWGPLPGPWGANPQFRPWRPPQGSDLPHGYQGPTNTGMPFHQAPPLPPLPPPPIPGDTDPVQLANMLMSWYISGYHTGYYQASREAARAAKNDRK